MSANDQDNRPKPAYDLPEDDDDYGDDLNLDLELERVIKHLDEATSESPPPLANPAPPEPRRAPEPPLTARTPVPARDPKPKAANSADTVLLTERLGDSPPPPPSRRRDQAEVVDLIDEIEGPHGLPYPSAGVPYQSADFEDLTPSARVIGEMTPSELGEVIAQAVERALRRYFSR
jgi:hypothetical protein